MCRVISVFLAILWVFPAQSEAKVYKWKDEKGRTHFTDDLHHGS